ncbi:upc2 protein [Colletotrichum incanum]|uniref:Upc2 protein n=1 Tax=Colletotrichum incanum TaxID=1573173 RepID=A0A167CFY0_COLIC|nr:upc2 protein [Colletotrichum incanum]
MAPQTRNHSPALGGGSTNGDTPGTPGASAGDVKLRRAHRKSRNGCKECKRRHVKCDETRPTCVNCATAERHCSYLDSLPASARSAVSAQRGLAAGHRPASSGSQTGGGGMGGAISNSVPAAATSPSVTAVVNDFVMRTDNDREVVSPANGQFFTLEHMRLLHHLETSMGTFMAADEFMKPLVDMNLENALNAPYLMDVLLGLSAQHMAELNPSRADHYRHQATQLQTRALRLFNDAKEEISEETCIPMFLFASTLGTHLLCDTLRSYRHDFNAFLDQFAWYLNLHRGVSTVTGRSWHIIRESGAKEFIEFLETTRPSKQAPEVDLLHRMLDQADLGPASLQACRGAAETLRHSYAIYRSISERSTHQSASVMSFGVRVTTGFIDVLKQRRPEALVILAFYAVLLHWCRDFWVFADAGEFLIRSISAHLGDYWSEWLAFPISVLEGYAR